jgi:hypothetical protein
MGATWKDITAPGAQAVAVTAAQVATGPVIPPQQRLLTYSPAEWEGFVEEWVYYCLKAKYSHVLRFAGAGDMGIDIAGFTDKHQLQGVWDNYQCKHYDHALTPTDVWAELGKVIWYSFSGKYTAPRSYYFVAPKGAGTSLSRLMAHPAELKKGLLGAWDKNVKDRITSTQSVSLDGALRAYIDTFDFGIFSTKTSLQLVDDHRASPVHAARFGGGLKPRPPSEKPPEDPVTEESRYVSQLLEAYSEHTSTPMTSGAAIPQQKLKDHFRRQREAFYEAEALRVFARDNVPAGTFESLQNDIYECVIDVHDQTHGDGYQKVCAVTQAAQRAQLTANALISCANPKDRNGICHQLVNDERLWWKTS